MTTLAVPKKRLSINSLASLAGWTICATVLVPTARGAAPAADATTVTVHKAPFSGDATFDGVFDARQMQEVAVRPEAWKEEYIIREIAAPGTAVKAGEVVLKIDSAKLQEGIADLEATLKAGEIGLRQHQIDLESLEKTSPGDLQAARRAKQTADEDLTYFVEKDREQQTKAAEFAVKSAEQNLMYIKEELRQLEKMYRGDDLREDTEEIILTRQRNQVDAARYALTVAQSERDHELKTALPRHDEELRRAAEKAALALEKLEVGSPVAIATARSELEKLRMEQANNVVKLEKLRHDLQGMTVRSLHRGVIYYGENQQGKWATAAALAPKLATGKPVQPFEVLLTVVGPESIEVRAEVPESDLHLLRNGQTGYVIPTGYPDERIPATLSEAPPYPDVSGKFWARLTLDTTRAAKLAHPPVPGMTCSVKLNLFPKSEAISIPSKALFSDDGTEPVYYVYVKAEGGKPARRDVKIGRRTSDRVEITSGLKDGDTVVLERPSGV